MFTNGFPKPPGVPAGDAWGRIARATTMPAALLFFIALSVYLLCLRPCIWYGDQTEFVLFSGYLAPGHYAGYPFPNQLYFLPHLLGISPFLLGSILGGVLAAAAVAAMFLVWRELGVRATAAFPLALAFAFTPAFWDWGTSGAEVYNLEVLTAALIFYLTIIGIRRDDLRFYLAAAFIFGLACGNRISFVILLIWLIPIAFLYKKKRFDLIFVAMALGVSVYLFLVFRDYVFGDQDYKREAKTAKYYCDYFLLFRKLSFSQGLSLPDRKPIPYIISHLIFQLKYGCLALGILGWILFQNKEAKRFLIWGLLTAILAASLYLFANYVGPYGSYLILPTAIIITFAAAGAEKLFALGRNRTSIGIALGVLLFALPGYNLYRNWDLCCHRHERGCDSLAREGLATAPLRGSIVGEHWYFMPFAYYRWTLHARPDLTLHSTLMDQGEQIFRDLPRNDLMAFGDPGVRTRPVVDRPLTFVVFYCQLAFNPTVKPHYLPGVFLSREVTRLSEGQRFAALATDACPVALEKESGRRGWRTFVWSQNKPTLMLQWKIGTTVFLTGTRTAEGLDLYAATKWGACRGLFRECPDNLAPGPPFDIVFATEGDAPYGLSSLEMELGPRRYKLPSPGVLFLPLHSNWSPAAEPRLFWSNRGEDFTVWEYTPPPVGKPSPPR